MNLSQGEFGEKYTIHKINTDDEELDGFLFTLGCYSGEEITLVSKISGNYVVAIKDGRYNIDQDLAKAIIIAED